IGVRAFRYGYRRTRSQQPGPGIPVPPTYKDEAHGLGWKEPSPEFDSFIGVLPAAYSFRDANLPAIVELLPEESRRLYSNYAF
ncbi:MAG: hypothetical protein WB555_15505, partial [Candidatus Korobacteraceae bacterium]